MSTTRRDVLVLGAACLVIAACSYLWVRQQVAVPARRQPREALLATASRASAAPTVLREELPQVPERNLLRGVLNRLKEAAKPAEPANPERPPQLTGPPPRSGDLKAGSGGGQGPLGRFPPPGPPGSPAVSARPRFAVTGLLKVGPAVLVVVENLETAETASVRVGETAFGCLVREADLLRGRATLLIDGKETELALGENKVDQGKGRGKQGAGVGPGGGPARAGWKGPPGSWSPSGPGGHVFSHSAC